MFSEKDFNAEGFESSWKNEKCSSSQSVQTTEFKTRDQISSTTTSTSIETQTEDNHAEIIESVDMDKLNTWLKSVCPNMLNELKDMSISNSMAVSKLYDDSLVISANMLQQINVANKDEKNSISALSWNSTGNTLAVSCSYSHNTWCHHQGQICLYTFDRKDILPSAPAKILNCVSCVTSLCYHPTQPSILCAGTISGEIYIWNNQSNEGDNLIAMVSAHDDRISLVQWVTNIDPKKSSPVLVSAGLDSYLILWDANIEDKILKIKQRYTTGKINKSITSPEVFSRKSEGGIIQFDFSPHVSNLFVLGMEGGSLIKCSLLGAKSLITGEDSNVLNPFISYYEQHEGEITSIQFSPHRKELFLSCGMDNEIKIFHIDQVTPVQIIFMELELYSVSWVMHEERLIIGCGQNGAIRLYSLLNGQPIPKANSNDSESFTKLAINQKRIGITAFGNANGQIQLWTIPWNNIAIQDYSNVYGKKNTTYE